MSLKNSKSAYGKISISLHWLMAIMIIGLVTVGFYMTSMEDGDDKWQLYGLHKATGVVVLIFAVLRWLWTLSNPKVSPLESYSKMEIGLSHASKWLLMLMMLVMPLSGLLMSMAAGRATSVFGLFSVPGFEEQNRELAGTFHDIHVTSGWIIAILIGLHLLFAVKHHFLDKDATLKRILGRA